MQRARSPARQAEAAPGFPAQSDPSSRVCLSRGSDGSADHRHRGNVGQDGVAAASSKRDSNPQKLTLRVLPLAPHGGSTARGSVVKTEPFAGTHVSLNTSWMSLRPTPNWKKIKLLFEKNACAAARSLKRAAKIGRQFALEERAPPGSKPSHFRNTFQKTDFLSTLIVKGLRLAIRLAL